jgi:hypothetical protein
MWVVLTSRVEGMLLSDFSPDVHERAVLLVNRLAEELSTWRIVAESDRVEVAALAYAGGDLTRLRDAVELALVDWRDLLMTTGHG